MAGNIRLLKSIEEKQEALQIKKEAVESGIGFDYAEVIKKAFPDYYKQEGSLPRLVNVWNLRTHDQEILNQIKTVTKNQKQ